MSDVKSINSLMSYLRDTHGINIKGSSHKKKLRNIGYYHGYKGYRYIASPVNKIPYRDFNEILAINNFDMKLKSIIYPQIMFIETAIKNYVLEVVLEKSQSDNFNVIYNKLLTEYKNYSAGTRSYKDAFKKRLDLRNTIHHGLTRNYSNNKKVVQHFYDLDKSVPIWAIFETISLGEFGFFMSCLEKSSRIQISKNLKLHQGCDAEGKLTQTIIYALKDLRNSVAHNDIIFDTRFKSGQINSSLITCLNLSTSISGIMFSSIVDYIILIAYMLKNLEVSKSEINRFISDFDNTLEVLRAQIPINIYNSIIDTQTKNKLILLKQFVKI
ncbi:Abi family protein [Clostridium sp. CS001]|uniref:Abi family protein n=1 Tax=Clostridium sp. CS001 TaxID=2880648 RepID=UPI001CF3D3E3|nr:Abi family protein [Clostridium sp. CS001]MCB2291567.1 Abi family protein [Clostridium sp. CS001]